MENEEINENRIIKNLLVKEIDDYLVALDDTIKDFGSCVQNDRLSEYFLESTSILIGEQLKKIVTLRKLQEKYKED